MSVNQLKTVQSATYVLRMGFVGITSVFFTGAQKGQFVNVSAVLTRTARLFNFTTLAMFGAYGQREQ